MQEFVPESLFSGGVQLIVISVHHVLWRGQLIHGPGRPDHGADHPGAALQLIQRHPFRRGHQLAYPGRQPLSGVPPAPIPFSRHAQIIGQQRPRADYSSGKSINPLPDNALRG